VKNSGILKKRGINLPLSDLKVPALSDEDKTILSAIL